MVFYYDNRTEQNLKELNCSHILRSLNNLFIKVHLMFVYNRTDSLLLFILQVVCVGSIEELEQLSGQKVTDLHRES